MLCLTCSLYSYLMFALRSFSPGGELNAGEDEVEGLKRLLTEVSFCNTIWSFCLKFTCMKGKSGISLDHGLMLNDVWRRAADV